MHQFMHWCTQVMSAWSGQAGLDLRLINPLLNVGLVRFKVYKPDHYCCPAYISHQISFLGNPITNKSCDLQIYCVRFSVFSVLEIKIGLGQVRSSIQIRLGQFQYIRLGLVHQIRLGLVRQIRLGLVQYVRLGLVRQIRFGMLDQVRLVLVCQIRFSTLDQVRLVSVRQIRFSRLDYIRLGLVHQIRFSRLDYIRLDLVCQIRLGSVQYVHNPIKNFQKRQLYSKMIFGSLMLAIKISFFRKYFYFW